MGVFTAANATVNGVKTQPFNGVFTAANAAANGCVFTPVCCCVCSHKHTVKRLQTAVFAAAFVAV
ncbi:hypothetical protein Hanom_Chr00s001178g01675281 [Helianthus anomalus]